MTVTLLRMEDMSLQHWIKDVVIPLKWVEKVVNAPLVFNSEKSVYEAEIQWLPSFLDEGRGWVFFEPQGTETCVVSNIPSTEQSTRVTVYNEVGTAIGASLYTVNYKEGTIAIPGGGTTTADGTPTTIDFYQYYVSIIDGWPGTKPPELPVVAVEIKGYDKRPFQLGGGRKSVRTVAIDIFATSSAERDDLTEFLHDSIYNRHLPVFDFRDGEPLTYDGEFNTTWSGTLLKMNNNDDALFYFRNIKVEHITGRQDWSDLNRWRSRITFEMESFRDGLDFNALS
jgi:hypothetical protein